MNNKALVKELSENTGKSVEEINELIKTKILKFSGLLTEQGAIFMLQKEFGIKKEFGTKIKINELTDGMKDFEIQGTIKTIYPIKEFEKNNKKGKILSFLLEDDTGIIRTTLWNDQIEKYDLTQGSEIKIINGFSTSYNEKKQLSLGFNGEIEILKKREEEFLKISDLKAGLNNINIIGRLLRKYPCKNFENDEKKGKLCNFQFGDETSILRATAWNEKAEELENIIEGTVIEIKNAYTKQGLYGIELNLSYNTIIKNSSKELPKTIEIIKENIIEKKINELTEKENSIILGKIKEFREGIVFFNSCGKCGKKIENKICDNCGEVKEIKKAVLNIILEDETGEITATFFGENALKIINLTQEEFEKKISEQSIEKILKELNENFKEKKIRLLGFEKINNYTNEKEFVVKEIIL